MYMIHDIFDCAPSFYLSTRLKSEKAIFTNFSAPPSRTYPGIRALFRVWKESNLARRGPEMKRSLEEQEMGRVRPPRPLSWLKMCLCRSFLFSSPNNGFYIRVPMICSPPFHPGSAPFDIAALLFLLQSFALWKLISSDDLPLPPFSSF